MLTPAERQLGRHYTPRNLAQRIVRAGLDALSGDTVTSSCRVLDPACGDGVFLLEALDELRERRRPEVETREIVRDCLFGVDIDPAAVSSLRRSLIGRITADQPDAAAKRVIESNIRLGDAITGPGFEVTAGQPTPARGEPSATGGAEPLDWDAAFPAIAGAGGFDLIVGNPPYLRERDARELFARLATTEMGRRWREARMDLWYYFVHRSLDLLRPGGVLSFVVNSYWTASRGARKLIARLERETRFEEIELLGDEPLFEGVTGRHMIFRLRKNRADGSPATGDGCRIVGPACRAGPQAPPGLTSGRPSQTERGVTARPALRAGPEPKPQLTAGPLRQSGPTLLSHAELFQHGRLVLAPPDGRPLARGDTLPLGASFDTRQGMAENPPAITRRLAREFDGRYAAGEGVFVLTAREVDRLGLTDRETQLLRPYFDTVAIRRYSLPPDPTHQVLYLTRETAPTLDDCPHIAAHLSRFRPILERRRETRLGRCAWWHLHWPRDESIFLRPRILSVQMGRRPQFVFVDRPAYFGFSVNAILERAPDAPSLSALTGLLNSTTASGWFEGHAKRRGIHLDINAHVLRQFPLPGRSPDLELRIAELVRYRQDEAAEKESLAIDGEIEHLVEKWYGW